MERYISVESVEEILSRPITMSMCLTTTECRDRRLQREADLNIVRSIPNADVYPASAISDAVDEVLDVLDANQPKMPYSLYSELHDMICNICLPTKQE